MSRTSHYAFILAKVYGILARSFVGKNFRDLLRLSELADLYDRLFPGERREVPPQGMTVMLEARIVRAGIDAMTYVLDFLGEPVEILVHILRKLEYQSLKTALRAMVNGRAEEPRIWDLGAYAGIKLAGARDYEKVIASSRYAWVLPLLGTTPLAVIENKLDKEYYARLLQLARALPARDGTGVLRLVNLSIALANVIWALRLRFFYGMEGEKARDLLIPGLVDAQRTAVARVFEMQPDSVEEWRKWKYAWLIEDQLGESFHSPDPVRAEQKAGQRLYARARQIFHQNPFTLSPLVAYFTLKEHEVALLKTAVEAVHLSVAEQDVLAIVGAS